MKLINKKLSYKVLEKKYIRILGENKELLKTLNEFTQIIKELKSEKKYKYRDFDPRIKKIIRLRRLKFSYREIGRLMNISHETIRRLESEAKK